MMARLVRFVVCGRERVESPVSGAARRVRVRRGCRTPAVPRARCGVPSAAAAAAGGAARGVTLSVTLTVSGRGPADTGAGWTGDARIYDIKVLYESRTRCSAYFFLSLFRPSIVATRHSFAPDPELPQNRQTLTCRPPKHSAVFCVCDPRSHHVRCALSVVAVTRRGYCRCRMPCRLHSSYPSSRGASASLKTAASVPRGARTSLLSPAHSDIVPQRPS